MSFINERFPTDISEGSEGGPKYNTSVVSVKSGRESRNINWDYPRIEYDVVYGVDTMEKLQELIAFFHIVQGKGYSFRFRDHSDYKSCRLENTPAFDDQQIGTGDGSTSKFQLKKTYKFGGVSRLSREITKPIENTVVTGIDSVPVESANFDVDYTTGIVTFGGDPVPINSVSGESYLYVDGDVRDRFSEEDRIKLINSSNNNGIYSINTIDYISASGETEIQTNETSLDDSDNSGDIIFGPPADGAKVTAGYEYDIHARFDTDELSTRLESYQTGSIDVPVIEEKV